MENGKEGGVASYCPYSNCQINGPRSQHRENCGNSGKHLVRAEEKLQGSKNCPAARGRVPLILKEKLQQFLISAPAMRVQKVKRIIFILYPAAL